MAKKSGTKTAIGAALVIGVAALIAIGVNQQEPGLELTAEAYGENWPFTVPAGRIECEPDQSRTIRADGQIYALNGRAQDRGYQRIDPIWKDDPRFDGAKVNLQPIIDAAGELCG